MKISTSLIMLLWFCLYDNTKSAPAPLQPKEKQNEYNLQLKLNNGHVLNEKVKIDPVAGTEYFRVPSHGSKDEIEVMQDFSKKLTMIHEKSENACYLSKLTTEASPDDLKAAIESKLREDNELELREITTWRVDKDFTQRSLLNEEMAMMCARSSIYWIQKIEETGSVRQSRDTGHSRVRRASPCAKNRICWYEFQFKLIKRDGKTFFTKIRVKKCKLISC
ncbi:uncharacterized protein LOC116292436 [Actinia tenebrosa]|uniref:Uncharacterized protein LOC116292436 n=1 Tax=Actinia tenebrosa TaxID=6105 RepID=A0A6P8HSG6_ACTTE|nr:uncharacterized protein LOC116292436 [Actinia tenebrosa]